MHMHALLLRVWLVGTLSILAGCPTTSPSAPPAQSAGSAGSPQLAIPNAREPLPGVMTGGQPSATDLESASSAGYRTVISLRPEGEAGSEGEQEKVEALGMRFVSIPVAGADGITIENAQKLASELAADGTLPAIVHCASGNRAGALLAMKAFHFDGQSAEEALELGRQAGLASLEPVVAARLQK